MRGHDVELANTGEQALARFCEADFEITLMDVKLPGMNGVETFFEFRKVRPDALVLLMTGFSVEHLIAQAVENGALDRPALGGPPKLPDQDRLYFVCGVRLWLANTLWRASSESVVATLLHASGCLVALRDNSIYPAGSGSYRAMKSQSPTKPRGLLRVDSS